MMEKERKNVIDGVSHMQNEWEEQKTPLNIDCLKQQ